MRYWQTVSIQQTMQDCILNCMSLEQDMLLALELNNIQEVLTSSVLSQKQGACKETLSRDIILYEKL